MEYNRTVETTAVGPAERGSPDAPAAPTQQPAALPGDALGLAHAAFQPITTMGPAASVVASLLVVSSFAGGAMPLAILVAAVACVFVASSIGQLAKHMPSSASFATYAARSLHPAVGAWVGWIYASGEALLPPLFPLIIGFFVSGTFTSSYGWSSDTWIIWALLSIAIVFAMGYRGINASARASLYLGIFELAVLLVLFVWLSVDAGSSNTLSVFTLHFASVKGFAGFAGIVAGSVYAFLAFTGFEAAAPLAEETKNPKKVIPRAVVMAAVVVGLLYVFSGYAAAVHYGPDRMAGFATANSGNPWQMMAKEVWGAGWIILLLAVINSCLAGGNASTNAVTRTWYGMGRIKLLPHPLASIHPKWGTPYVAILVQTALSLALVLGLGLAYGPLTAFSLLATVFVLMLLSLYVLMNLSCIAYYLRVERRNFNILLHGVMPVLGIIMLVPAILAAGGWQVFSFISPLPSPLSYGSIAFLVLMAGGAVYVGYLYRSGRQSRVAATEVVFLENIPAMDGHPASPLDVTRDVKPARSTGSVNSGIS